jgi:rhodanese-related sulfurtransferase
MTYRAIRWVAPIMLAVLLTATAAWAAALMSIDALKAELGSAEMTIVDVRSPHDWQESDRMIQGARRMDPGDMGWVLALPRDRVLVFYCT